jgi:hypothetical protein
MQWTIADEHGTPAQRFFNPLSLCLRRGRKRLADVMSSGLPPEDRAVGCERDYAQTSRLEALNRHGGLAAAIRGRLRNRRNRPIALLGRGREKSGHDETQDHGKPDELGGNDGDHGGTQWIGGMDHPEG